MVHQDGTAEPAQPALRWLGPVMWLVAAVPVVIGLAVAARTHWYPTGDMAQAELHVRGIWEHPPLVGAAGRISNAAGVQGSHPGPSLWFAIYPVYALLGRTTFGLMAGVASVHLASFAAALWLARRRGGVAMLALVGLLVVVLVRSSGPAFFLEPWNPWLAVFPFLVFLLAAWELAEGHLPMAVVAVVAGSHCVQCHTGYVVVVLGLLAAAGLWGGWRSWSARGPAEVGRWAAAAVGAGLVMWLPPIVDQLTRDPGNMSILLDNFSHPDEPYLAKGVVARAVGSQLSLFGPWLTGPALLTRNLPAVVLTLALWAVAVGVAWRHRDRPALTLHGLLAVGVVLGLFSVERIFGSYLEYTIRWFWVLTGLVVVASVWTLWRRRGDRLRATGSARAALAGVVAVAVAVGAVSAVQFAARADVTGRIDSDLVGAVVDDVEANLPDGAYLVRWFDPVGLGAVPFGLLLELARRGYDVGVDEQFAAAALPQRVLPEDRADGILYVVLGPRADEVRAMPGFTELATADLRDDAQRARSAELEAQLRRRFVEIGRPELVDRLDAQYGWAALIFVTPPLPPDVAGLVSELVELRLPVSVFLAPPGTPLP